MSTPRTESTPEQPRSPTPRDHEAERSAAALSPLGPDERPRALMVASAVALVLAVAIAVGTATINDLHSHGGSVLGGIFLSLLLLALAVGLYRRSYWAVLGFEALLAFQIVTATLGLVLAGTYWVALGWLATIALGGLLFWKLIRVMGRIQAGRIERR